MTGGNERGPSDSGTSAEVGSAGPTIAQPQTFSRGPVAPAGNVSISIPPESSNTAVPTVAGQAAAAAVQAVAIQANQVQIVATSAISTGRVGGYANTAIIGPSDETAVPPPPSSAEPPLAPRQRRQRTNPKTRSRSHERPRLRPGADRLGDVTFDRKPVPWPRRRPGAGLAGWDAKPFQLLVDGGDWGARRRRDLRRHESA